MNRPVATGRDRPEYDDPEKDKAARFLYSDVEHECRIQGIETVRLAEKWLDVETDRMEPRPEIIAALNRRVQTLRISSDTKDSV